MPRIVAASVDPGDASITRPRERGEGMLAFELSAHGPFVLAGVVVGVFAFLPMWLALEPVLRRGREANMTKGMLSVGASFVALLLGIVVVHVLFHGVLVAFVAGEIGGFLAGSVVVACLVIAAE